MGSNTNLNVKLKPEELRDKMFTNVWSGLTDNDKINVLRQISDNHLKEQGIEEKHRPILEFENMRVGVNGAYDPDTNTIVLSRELLQDKNMFKVVETLHHEGYHAYQHDLIKHPEGYPANQESSEIIGKWKQNFKQGAYISNTDLLYQKIYAGQAVEDGAFPHGIDKMKAFFESKEMLGPEKKLYEKEKNKREENFQILKDRAIDALGVDYLRKTDIVVNYRGINVQANELSNEMDNKQNTSPEMTKEISEIKTDLNKLASWDLLPVSLKHMSEQELQNTEKELNGLQNRLDDLQKQYEKSLHVTKTMSMASEKECNHLVAQPASIDVKIGTERRLVDFAGHADPSQTIIAANNREGFKDCDIAAGKINSDNYWLRNGLSLDGCVPDHAKRVESLTQTEQNEGGVSQQPSDAFDFHKALAAHIKSNEEMYAQIDAQRGVQNQQTQQSLPMQPKDNSGLVR